MKMRSIAVGDVQVTPLRDAVVDYPWPLSQMFPEVPAEAWEPYRERYPDAFGDEPQTYRSTYRCYLLRSERATVLVDTGTGPPSSPLSAAWGLDGALPRELEAAGVEPEDIDIVILTHLHPDHVGGTLRDGELAFPNARYVVPDVDWHAFQLPEVQAHLPISYVDETITPLERLGALELVSGEHSVTDEVTLLPTPGHTPGHTSIRIESRGERVLLVADALLHPAQVTEPDWRPMVGADPEQDRRTRHRLLDQLEAEQIVFSASHFPDPAFGRVVREDGRRYWAPL